ncbi:MAG: apolipoprotein N-acyltransferase [Ostreibacterium sp.]
MASLINTRWIYLSALVLGFIQALAFDIAFDSLWIIASPVLSFISLLGFLYLLQHLTPKRALLFGYLFGIGVFGWGLNWVYISMANFGGASLLFAVFANVAVVAYLALYWLLNAYLICRLGTTPNQRLLLAAPIIALLEWLRSVFLFGFPWLSIGYGWIETPLSHLSSFGGVFFISFIVVCIVALLLLKWQRWYKSLLLAVVLMLIPIIYYLSMSPQYETRTLKVALLQGNMPVITDYNEVKMVKNLTQYHRLTEQVLDNKEKPDVIIWPESAVPYFYNQAKPFLNTIKALQTAKGVDLITGITQANVETKAVYNAMLFQEKNSIKAIFYNKQHLLPFGEYLPFRSIFAFFKDFVNIPMSDFSRGKMIQKGFKVNGVILSPSICFEIVFGDEIRQNAQHAGVLLNISNDAWFGQSKAQTQHLNIARMRAIENNKYLIRSTNNGLTAIVKPDGEIQASMPAFQSGYVTGIISPNNQKTLYTRYGDRPWLMFFILIIIAVLLYTRLRWQ